MKLKPIIFLVYSLLTSISSFADGKEKFPVQVVKVTRGEEGCAAEVRSDTVFYHISSKVSGDCAFLRAGERYNANVFSGHAEGVESSDHSADKVVLIIFSNRKEDDSSVFAIDSEETEKK